MEKEGFSEMLKIVLSMLSRQESDAFRNPVDWKAMNLPDYPEIIKKPMDLGTIRKGIESNKYDSVESIATDIRLVWTNCMLYNRDGSEYYHLADTFAKSFEEAYAAFRRLEDSKADLDRIPTVDERIQLSYDIFKIDNTEVARVLTMIEASCPSALSRKHSSDEVLINLDALTPRCFHEINGYIMNCFLSSGGRGGSKKRKSNPTDAQSSTQGSSSASSSAKSKKGKSS